MNGAAPVRAVERGTSAFCDESLRCRPGGNGIYMMSAVVMASRKVQDGRDEMAALLLAGQRKLHWHAESAQRRLQLARCTAAIECEILIATWCQMGNAQQERARRKTQLTLLPALVERGVTDAIFESRGSVRDKADITGLAGLRRSGALPDRLWVSHAAGPVEGMLWAADVAVGAFGAALDGKPEYWAEILTSTKVTILTCGQCGLVHAPHIAHKIRTSCGRS